MFKYILLMFIMITVGASGVMYYTQTLFRSTLLMQNKLQAIASLNRLKQSVIFENGNYYLPYGEQKADHHELPLSFAGSRTTQNGIPMVYCPYAPHAVVTATNTVQLTSLFDYNVTTNTTLSPDGAPYVVASEPAPTPGVLGFILIPQAAAVLPVCSDVTVNGDGRFVLSGGSLGRGIAYALHQDEMTYLGQNGRWLYADKQAGVENLNALLTEVAQHPHEDAVLTLKAGESFTLTDNFLLTSGSASKRRSVLIKSTDVSNPATINAGAILNLDAQDVDIHFAGVNLGSNIRTTLKKTNTTFERTNAYAVDAYDSQLTLDTANFGVNNSPLTPLVLHNSQVTHSSGQVTLSGNGALILGLDDSQWLSDGANVAFNVVATPLLVQLGNSQWVQRNSQVNVSATGNAQALFLVDGQSKLTLSQTTWNQSGNINYGIYASGEVHLLNTQLNATNRTNVAVHTEPGATLVWQGSVIGGATLSLIHI